MLAQVRSGALEFMTNSGLLLSSLVPSASLPGVAYTFEDYPAVWRALDGDLGALVRRNIERTNLVVFERIFDAGFFNILTGNREIAGPSDLEGLKLRVPPSPMWITLYKALKAAAPAQGCRAHHRDRHTGPHRVYCRLPRGRAVPRRRPQPATRRAMTTGPIAPDPPRLANPDAQHIRTEIAMKQAQC